MSRSAPPTAFAFAVLLAAAALLTACTSAPPEATGPAAPSATKTSSPGADEATPAPIEAVLVVASVDVDGRNVTASGYVQGTVQDSGTCEFTFSANGSEFTVEHDASADRMTTSCGSVQVPIEKFQRGPWKVTVGMTIDGTPHTSEATTVEVP
ncbi:hypothetical protein KNO15_15995 [Leifsonia shinshuensis]|uniref:hypothetical protein n=1 Tax=Leifsonia shinshuensis TaxID=150026 RepID=UPI001F50A061|nr:hypothetical protein [Leifsonia shinshuensis]MCI0158203.1 hypothetical protein [Leifsonia shinshuensis]